MTGRVASLSASPEYTFTKSATNRVRLIEGIGVEGDIHSGETVKPRSRVRADLTQPNLRQVHLITSELLAELEMTGVRNPCVQLNDVGGGLIRSFADVVGE